MKNDLKTLGKTLLDMYITCPLHSSPHPFVEGDDKICDECTYVSFCALPPSEWPSIIGEELEEIKEEFNAKEAHGMSYDWGCCEGCDDDECLIEGNINIIVEEGGVVNVLR